MCGAPGNSALASWVASTLNGSFATERTARNRGRNGKLIMLVQLNGQNGLAGAFRRRWRMFPNFVGQRYVNTIERAFPESFAGTRHESCHICYSKADAIQIPGRRNSGQRTRVSGSEE